VQQLELFPEFKPKPSSAKSPQLTMSSEALHSWKKRIFEHQQSEAADQPGVAELGYDEVVLRASKITHI
jgi:hypothetical protein